MAADQLRDNITELQGGSRLVKHPAVGNSRKSGNVQTGRAAFCSTGGIWNAGQTTGDTADSKRGGRGGASAVGRSVADAMHIAEAKIIEQSGVKRVCPSYRGGVIAGPLEALTRRTDDEVVIQRAAGLAVKHAKNMVGL